MTRRELISDLMNLREWLGALGQGFLVLLILDAAGIKPWTSEWCCYGLGMILAIGLLRIGERR